MIGKKGGEISAGHDQEVYLSCGMWPLLGVGNEKTIAIEASQQEDFRAWYRFPACF